MRTSLGALVTALALTATVSCGASDGDAADDPTTPTGAEASTTTTEADETTTEPEVEGVDLEEWAVGFCADFEGWLAAIEETSTGVGDGIEASNLNGRKTALVEMFEASSALTDDLIAAVEDGGAPAIEDGEELVDDLVGKFEAFGTAIASAQTEAEALATGARPAFEAEVRALQASYADEVTKVGESFAELDEDYPDPELSAALSEACSSF